MKQLIYDIEVFPNFFCVCLEEYGNDNKYYFEISPWQDDRSKMMDFIKGNILIGYNSLAYDNIVMNYIIDWPRSNDDIYNMSKNAIRGDYENTKAFRYPKTYTSIDIMTMLFSKMQRVSLKELAVNVNYPKIQDLPKHFDDFVEEHEVEEIKNYCFNDVGVTKYITILSKNNLNLRMQIEKKYKIKCMSKDDVNTGVELFKKFYADDTGSDSFKDQRTNRDSINLSDCISDKINFKSKAFNDLLTTLKNKRITETKGALKYSVIYGGVMHNFGTGGIHSKDKPGIIEASDDEIFIDADVSSLYPSLWIKLKLCPEHLDKNIFLPRYEWLRDTRVTAKKEGNMLISDTYKLSLNGSYGNLINPFSWLYDPKVAMTITLNGQLMLSMLSEQFTNAGIRVDSLNTDGITAIVKKKDLDTYYKICKEWEKHTELELEYNNYYKVFRRDVNSYIAWFADKDGKPLYKNNEPVVKQKGFFLADVKLGKGFDKPVVKKALNEYFINGTPVDEFIKKHDNIYDFCMMQKMNAKFQAMHNGKKLQKTNRFYASVSESAGYLFKKDRETGAKGHVLKDSGIIIFNDFYKKQINEYEINYEYYIHEAKRLISLIEPIQLSLF